MNENRFITAARHRGVRLNRQQLELLHRRRLLVPLFRIHQRSVTEGIDDLPRPRSLSSSQWDVWHAAAEGRLSDPGERKFRPWAKPLNYLPFFYSTYQLLALRSLSWTMQAMRARRAGEEFAYELDLPDASLRDDFNRTRALAIVLEVLAPRYRPRVMRVIRDPSEDLAAHIDDRDPQVEEVTLRFKPELVLNQAEHLLWNTMSFDPLGKWHRVARIGFPSRWKDLRGEALIAIEQRIAAEQLLLFYEDLEELGRAPTLPALSPRFHHARHDRLKVNQRERAETILDFRLIDRPAVVLALEGDAEVEVAARVLDLYGVEESAGFVQLVNLKSVDGDVRLLARAVAVPRLDPHGYVGARILSPLTALVVAVDPEKKYESESLRKAQHTAMVDEVLGVLPAAVQTPAMRADLEIMIQVRTWGTESFEFAHYTDHELAKAMLRLAGGGAPTAPKVKAAIVKCREHRGNLESVWKGWPSKPDKVRLAQEMWPILRARIQAARGRRPAPIAGVIEDVIRLGHQARRAREMAVPESE